jgi:hypothetical protein
MQADAGRVREVEREREREGEERGSRGKGTNSLCSMTGEEDGLELFRPSVGVGGEH